MWVRLRIFPVLVLVGGIIASIRYVAAQVAPNSCGALLVLRAATATPTPTPTPGSSFPQFSNTGAILTSYTGGQSLWLRDLFQHNSTVPGANTTDTNNAALNAYEDGGMYPYFPDTASWNCGTGSSWSLTCFHNNWLASIYNPQVTNFNNTSIPIVIFGNNPQSFPSYAFTAFTDIGQYMKAHAPAGML